MESSDLLSIVALLTPHIIALLIFCAVQLIIDRLARYDGKPWQRRLAYIYYLEYLDSDLLFIGSYIALFIAIYMTIIKLPPFNKK